MTPTTVISVRGRSRDELLADPAFVYVGRTVKFTAWTASPWGNPFGMGKSGLFVTAEGRGWWQDVGRRLFAEYEGSLSPIDLYDRWLDDARPDLIGRLPDLIGKTLGCWCGAWEPGQPPIGCHAYRLAVRANWLAGCKRRMGLIDEAQQREAAQP